jgi:hypothetical protein
MERLRQDKRRVDEQGPITPGALVCRRPSQREQQRRQRCGAQSRGSGQLTAQRVVHTSLIERTADRFVTSRSPIRGVLKTSVRR